MSAVEYYSVDTRWGARGGSVTMHDRLTRSRETSQPAARFGRISGMIETAENLARDYGISRQEADRYALGSQQRATAARERGAFADDDMDLVELNEAFACQVLAVLKGWGWHDESRLNVNGSGISLGHLIGAIGIRIMTTMLRELERRGGKYALESMCIGGGQGIAALFERP